MTSMHELQTGLWYRQAAHPDWNAATAGGWGPEVTSYEMLVRAASASARSFPPSSCSRRTARRPTAPRSSSRSRRGRSHQTASVDCVFTTMTTREAACHCGQLRLEVTGDPFAVSICNCLACQRRTGSAFGMQAVLRAGQVHVTGRFDDYSRLSDEADRKEHVFHFCTECGSQVFYTEPDEADLVVVSVGSFADPAFPPPTESGYDSRRHLVGPAAGLDPPASRSSCRIRCARSTRKAGTRRLRTSASRSSRRGRGDQLQRVSARHPAPDRTTAPRRLRRCLCPDRRRLPHRHRQLANAGDAARPTGPRDDARGDRSSSSTPRSASSDRACPRPGVGARHGLACGTTRALDTTARAAAQTAARCRARARRLTRPRRPSHRPRPAPGRPRRDRCARPARVSYASRMSPSLRSL